MRPSAHPRMAVAAGRRIVALEPLRLTREHFENAITVVLALGGSTNAVIHLIAMAGRAGVPLDLDRFDALARGVPVLANIRPSGKYLMQDFFEAGGLRALMSRLSLHDVPTVAGMLSEIQSQAMRAGEIIQRLRSFVKKQHPRPRPTDANDLVEETLRLLAFELRTSDVRLALRFAADLPQVLADHVQIGQVLVNLIRNALDALHDRGSDGSASQLTLTTARAADSSAVTIASFEGRR